MATMALRQAPAGSVKARLSDLLVSVSWADLARRYFGRSGSWLYHKLDGVDGNRKPTDFTPEERERLRLALLDLSERVRRAAESLEE